MPPVQKSPVDLRAEALDTIAAVLPLERRDELAELLTDQDVATLRHLVNEGMGKNTLRPCLPAGLVAGGHRHHPPLASTGLALLLKFVAHHVWNPEKRKTDPDHGMQAEIEESLRRQSFLKSSGPHAPATVRRRLASWSTLTRWRGLDGAFASPALKSAIRLAVRASPRQRRRK
jgi:hypothetical protein